MPTLSWELHAPGSEVVFHAAAGESGYAITLRRDGINLIWEIALDGPSLLRRSLELRRSFEQLGYAAIAHDANPVLRGGPCWGPGPLIPASALMAWA